MVISSLMVLQKSPSLYIWEVHRAVINVPLPGDPLQGRPHRHLLCTQTPVSAFSLELISHLIGMLGGVILTEEQMQKVTELWGEKKFLKLPNISEFTVLFFCPRPKCEYFKGRALLLIGGIASPPCPPCHPNLGLGDVLLKPSWLGILGTWLYCSQFCTGERKVGVEEESTQGKEDKEKRKYVCEHIAHYLDSK